MIVALAIGLLAALLWFRAEPPPARTVVAAAGAAPAPEAPPTPPETAYELLRGVAFLQNGLRAPYAILTANLIAKDLTRTHAVAFAEADGSFAMRIPLRKLLSDIELVVDHPKAPRCEFLLTDAWKIEGRNHDLVLESMTISGRAVDEEQRSLPYATIEILADPPPSLWSGQRLPELLLCPAPQADEEGRFSLRVQRRPVTVLVHTSGREPQRRTVPGRDEHVALGDIPLGPVSLPSPPLNATVR